MDWRRLFIDANWNIGFCDLGQEDLIKDRRVKTMKWLNHQYRDRWYADPFILKATEDEIVVFVEECSFDNPKGIICELIVERKTMAIKQRFVLLELGTHLSYPAIIRNEGKVYVYPENGQSGVLNIYEYDEDNHRLINPICILDEAVADATILKTEDKYIMLATKYPNTQEQAFLYESFSLFEMFKRVGDGPVQCSRSCSRPGGNWFKVSDSLFRPAQDCSKRYGGGLSIMKVASLSDELQEELLFQIGPISSRYNRGIHTINFASGICVVDGYGYLYQCLGRLGKVLKALKRIMK